MDQDSKPEMLKCDCCGDKFTPAQLLAGRHRSEADPGGHLIACVVTCRPQWKPWLEHQLAKQGTDYKLIVFDDCSKPSYADAIRPANRLQLTLGEKRQLVLDQVDGPFAWFDDDDWLPKERLAMGEKLTGLADVVGYHEGLFVDVKTLQTRRLDTGTRVVFNGAVFAPQCARHRFQPLNRGEDTAWLTQVLRDATLVTSPLMQHAWIAHDGNVTGKRGSMSFEGRKFDRLDSWERSFLENIR